jgi:hypothetical protein
MTELTLHGGPQDGRILNVNGSYDWINVPEYMRDHNAFVTHKYSAHTGEWHGIGKSYLGITLHEPYAPWRIELFPRWTAFTAKVRRLRSYRLRLVHAGADDDEDYDW